MNELENQYEYVEYISPYNILAVTYDGELIEINCPFKVKAKESFPEIKANSKVLVEKVQVTSEGKDVFIINGNAYLVKNFQIIRE